MFKKFFKRLMCEHENLEHITDIHGDMINFLKCRSLWVCTECGALIDKQELKYSNKCNGIVDKIEKPLFDYSFTRDCAPWSWPWSPIEWREHFDKTGLVDSPLNRDNIKEDKIDE